MASRTVTVTTGGAARAGVLAAVVAAGADLAIYALARASGVALAIPLQPGSQPQTLPIGAVLAAVAVGAAGATIARAVVNRLSGRALVFPAVGTAVLLLSLGAPLTLAATGAATKATLVLMHLVTGAVIIGLLNRSNRIPTEDRS